MHLLYNKLRFAVSLTVTRGGKFTQMKAIRALFLFIISIIPITAAAHPGGGLIAIDANTVIFGDSMYNAVWRLEKGKKPLALIKNFHAHWTTRGLDGRIYSESFQEMGGALFRID